MLAEIEQFLVLQDRDQKLARLQKELQRIPAEAENARSRLKAEEDTVAALRDKLNANDVATKNLELDIQTRRDTIGRLKTQQFETRKNEEFRALGHEIERYGNEVTKLEDNELELMEEAEGLKTQLDEAKAQLEKSSNLIDEELSALDGRKTACESQIADLKAERSSLTSGFDSALLGQYERLFKKKKDSAIAPLSEKGICGGCHMKVTSATLHSVRAEQEVTACENCGRLLYLEQ